MERRGILAAVMEGHLCAVLGAEDDQAVAAELADTGLAVGVGEAMAPAGVPTSHRTAGHALTQAGPSAPVVRRERIVDEGPLGLIDP